MGPPPSGLRGEKQDRALFSPIVPQTCDVAPYTSNAPSPVCTTPPEPASVLELSSPSSPIPAIATIYQNRAMVLVRGRDPASHQMEKIKARTDDLDSRIRDLKGLAKTLRGTAKEVAKDFNALKESVGELTHNFEALEADHIAALACLEEEKDTVNHYVGTLRNVEKELFLIYQKLEGHPDELDILPGGFSQAMSSEPIFERFA